MAWDPTEVDYVEVHAIQFDHHRDRIVDLGVSGAFDDNKHGICLERPYPGGLVEA